MTVKGNIAKPLCRRMLPLALRRVLPLALPLTALAVMAACSSEALDAQQASTQALDSDNGPWQMTVAVGGQQTASPSAGGNTYVVVGGATRGNSTGTGDTFMHGWQNTGQLDERNYTRVGLFSLAQGENEVKDLSWEKFNVCTDATTGAQAYDATSYPAWTHLLTTGYESNQLFYPSVRSQKVDVYAYVPYVSQAEMKTDGQLGSAVDFKDISSQTIKYTLELDQTEKNDYIDSDILWGHNTEEVSAEKFLEMRRGTAVGTSGAYIRKAADDQQPDVALTMEHKTAKIVFRLTAVGMQQEKLQNAVVKINVPYITGALKIKDGTFVPDGDAAANGNAVTMTSHLGIEAVTTGTATATLQGSVTEGGKTYYCCSALIVPQTVSTGYHFADIRLYAKTTAHTHETDTPADDNWIGTPNPPTANYSWQPSAAFTFESGKQYIFDVTVTPQALTVSTPYVLPWSEDASFTTPNVEASQKAPLTVGMLLFKDGSWGTLTDNTSGQVKDADDAIGYVFHVGTTEADRDLGFKNGYAMALKDATANGSYSYTSTTYVENYSGTMYPASQSFPAADTRACAWCEKFDYTDSGDSQTKSSVSSLLTGNYTGTWESFASDNGTQLASAMRNDLDGLTHCRNAKEKVGETNKSKLTAIMAAENYKNYPKAVFAAKVTTKKIWNGTSEETVIEYDNDWHSEWYLPSVGQWMAIMESTGIQMRTQFEQATQVGWDATPNPDGHRFYRWQSNSDSQAVISKLNSLLTGHGLAMGTHFDKIRCGVFDGWVARYWTSSEVDANGTSPWGIYFNYNAGSYDNLRKDRCFYSSDQSGHGYNYDAPNCYFQVRAVVAF